MWNAMLLSVAFWLAAGPAAIERERPAVIQAERPPCGAATLGLLWPAEANDDSQLAKRLAREGQLEICRWGPWRYGWASPTVHIRQLMELAAKKQKLGRSD